MTETRIPTMEELYVDPYPGKKGTERVAQTCGRCGGSGLFEWSRVVYRGRSGAEAPWCFDCDGSGTASVLVSSVRGTLRRRARLQIEAAERAAEAEARRATWSAEHADVVEALRLYGDRGEFLRNMAGRFAVEGALTDAQAEAVLKAAARYATEDAEEPGTVVAGRLVVEGVVVSVQERAGYTGGTVYKMLVKADGFDGPVKLWGTVPSALLPDVWTSNTDPEAELKGRRVRFTATLEPSEGDEAFGFYSRPTKATIVDA